MPDLETQFSWKWYQESAARTLPEVDYDDDISRHSIAVIEIALNLGHLATNVSSLLLYHKRNIFLRAASGLVGEVGEVVDYLKKVVFHGHELEVKDISKEIGDVLWYFSAIATLERLDLEKVVDGSARGFVALALHEFFRGLELLVSRLPVTLEECGFGNIKKLMERFPAGFTSADSISRADVKGE